MSSDIVEYRICVCGNPNVHERPRSEIKAAIEEEEQGRARHKWLLQLWQMYHCPAQTDEGLKDPEVRDG